MSRQFGFVFEDEVRNVLEVILGLEPGACQSRHYEGQKAISELDAYARLEDSSYLVMATIRTDKKKITHDCEKLLAAERREKSRGKACVKWIVTLHSIDALLIDHAKKKNVQVYTLAQLRARFFNPSDYHTCRLRSGFGSARNLSNDTSDVESVKYIPVPISATLCDPAISGEPKELSVDVKWIVEQLEEGEILVALGPFGAGKSLTVREVFLSLWNDFIKDRESIRPAIALNLREHWAQPFFYEMLTRHAQSLGFTPPENLIKAWRAGIVTILMDGFDELAAQTITRSDDQHFMRLARRESLTGVRDYFAKLTSNAGVLICGRDHYFDSQKELEHALGLSGKRYWLLHLSEFSEQQVGDFLRSRGQQVELPGWLPRKPLFLDYLISRDLLTRIAAIEGSGGFGEAWSSFLEMVCVREGQLERAIMDPDTLRLVLEYLAIKVRGTISGSGPLVGPDLSEAYRAITGQSAVEGVLAQLQRLPGLTERGLDPGERSFVDDDYLAALQGSGIARLILSGDLTRVGDANWLHSLSPNAVSMAVHILSQRGINPAVILTAARRWQEVRHQYRPNPQFIADCLQIAFQLAQEQESASLDCQALVVNEADIGTLDLEQLALTGITFRSCTIAEVILPAKPVSGVRFEEGCVIGKVAGVSSRAGLPKALFDQSVEVEKYDDLSTNSAVMKSQYAAPLKALLMVLRKLYLQPGAGRKVGAMTRGITDGAVAGYVDEVLRILEREGLISRFNHVLHPVRRHAHRVRQIMGAPASSSDPAVSAVKALDS